jgi:antirestriction protein ArdC
VNKIREVISHQILEALESGNPPWRSHYNRGAPVNALTNKKFTGINPLILDTIADKREYRSKYWATLSQWRKLGASVFSRPIEFEPGTYGVKIVNWYKSVKIVDKGDISSFERFNYLQTHTVFNADQCYGPRIDRFLCSKKGQDEKNYEFLNYVIENTGARIISEGLESPFYDYKNDKIFFPSREIFIDDAQYWATKIHEVVHWTEPRLNWSGEPHQNELIAEIATGYLESEFSLNHDVDNLNHDQWMPFWIENIRNNPKYIFDAAAQAARSVDYILNFTIKQERETDE